MAKFCQVCGASIANESASFCDKCGAKVALSQPEKVVAPEKTKESTLNSAIKWGAICCGGLILLSVISAFVFGMAGNVPSTSTPTLTVAEIKSQAQTIPYNNLMRNPENYKNSIVVFRGEIDQVQNIYGDSYMLRISTKKDSFLGMYSDDTIYVNYRGNRLLEGDIVDIWGKFVGLKSYTAVLGNEITIPEIDSLNIEIVKAKS